MAPRNPPSVLRLPSHPIPAHSYSLGRCQCGVHAALTQRATPARWASPMMSHHLMPRAVEAVIDVTVPRSFTVIRVFLCLPCPRADAYSCLWSSKPSCFKLQRVSWLKLKAARQAQCPPALRQPSQQRPYELRFFILKKERVREGADARSRIATSGIHPFRSSADILPSLGPDVFRKQERRAFPADVNAEQRFGSPCAAPIHEEPLCW